MIVKGTIWEAKSMERDEKPLKFISPSEPFDDQSVSFVVSVYSIFAENIKNKEIVKNHLNWKMRLKPTQFTKLWFRKLLKFNKDDFDLKRVKEWPGNDEIKNHGTRWALWGLSKKVINHVKRKKFSKTRHSCESSHITSKKTMWNKRLRWWNFLLPKRINWSWNFKI